VSTRSPSQLLGRLSDLIVAHPIRWALGAGVTLVLLGAAFNIAPVVVVAGGVLLGVLNVVHAGKRGYCPLPADPISKPDAE
jgi:hypothetical protein